MGRSQFDDVNFKNPQNIFVIVKANDFVSLYLSHQPMTGVLSFKDIGIPKKESLFDQMESPVIRWSMKGLERKPFCFKVQGITEVYTASNVIDGHTRPYGGPHMWISESLVDEEPEWVKLKWEKEKLISEIHLTFNDDVNEYLINLHHHRTLFDIIPELIKDYQIQIMQDNQWKTVQTIKENRKRKMVHYLDSQVTSDSLRVLIESTNGCPRAEIIEVRVY